MILLKFVRQVQENTKDLENEFFVVICINSTFCVVLYVAFEALHLKDELCFEELRLC